MIDSHHHIWRQQDLPWLLGPEQPRIFGEYAGIKRDYLIDEYISDIAQSGITKSVYIQANWATNWFADEAAWVQSVADTHNWPHAIVAYADFTVRDVRPQLDKLKKYPLLRGIRQQLHWHENPMYRFAQSDDLGSSKLFQQNIARLAEYEWCFDLQVFTNQAQHAQALANACPEVNLILQHAGMPEDHTELGWSRWRKNMQRLAECENIFVKLSGLGTFVHKIEQNMIDSIVTQAVSMFGAERCMFGSNFPIEKLWSSYDELFNALRSASRDFTDQQKNAIFSLTAERVYRL